MHFDPTYGAGEHINAAHFYIDPPTIPHGMTVSEYRRKRAAERQRRIFGIRRVNARKMTV